MKKTAINTAIGIALGSALLVSTALEARPIRIDNGFQAGAEGAWDTAFFTAGSPFSLGFDVAFLGGSADTIVIGTNGGVSLLDGGTLLGSIVADTVASESTSAFAWDAIGFPADSPISSVDGQTIVDAFRVSWTNPENQSDSQIAFFTAANGDSYIELNYWDGFSFDNGINISEADTPLGRILNAGSVEQFNLRTYVAANQAACLQTWGALDDNNPPPVGQQPTGCTAYFPNADFTGVLALPPAFQVSQAGSAATFNELANYRYVVRYAAGTTEPPNPTPVPEPATLTLLLAGLSLTAAARLRKSSRA